MLPLAAVPVIGQRRLLSDSSVEAAVVLDAAPTGCDYRLRCPVGPAARPDREICVTDDPAGGAADRPHHAACHFAGSHVAG